MAEDKDRKKHPPSRRKLNRARKKGQVAISHQVCSSAAWFAGAVALSMSIPLIASSLSRVSRNLWSGNTRELSDLPSISVFTVFKAVTPCAVAAITVCLLVGFAQARVPLKIRMDWNRINPIRGFKRLFSTQRLVDLGLVLGRLSLVLLAAGAWLLLNWFSFMMVDDLEQGTRIALHEGFKLLVLVGMAGLLGGFFDLWLQRRRFLRNQRMTDEEVRRERKEQDGDPAIKAERRRIHRSVLAGSGFNALPTAKVVVINPTHIAVALRYDSTQDDAPVVIVSGRDERAVRIRAKAMSLAIPIIQQVQLARALVSLDEGESVPEAQYEAVAEVIRLVQSMM